MAILCLLKDDGTLDRQWKVGESNTTVGRGAAADLQIDDEGLSRRHFVIYREREDYWIRDLSSRNGTWVDGRRIQTTLLQHDDRILAGRTQFRFCDPSMVEAGAQLNHRGPHDTVVLPAR
jgi:pSer/pThr/pTyr-binding forkhead associated (FHA) protein